MIRDFYAAHKGAAAFAAATTAVALSVGYVLLPGLAPIVTLVIGWCVSVFVVAAGHWEAVEKHGGRALGLLAFASKSAERVGLSAEMQGIINSGRKDLSEEFAEIMPHPARLMFVRDAAELATLRDGEIVIALRDPSKHVENTARATLAYVAADTIRPARTYIDPLVMAGVHFSLTKRILRGSDSAALDYLINDLWDPTVRDNPRLRSICHQIESIERHGLLTRVLLVEFLELGRRLYGEFPPAGLHEESVEFVEHVARLADKSRHKDVELMFRRGTIRVGVVLVADRDKANTEGAGPYVSRSTKYIRAGCDVVYLLGRGARCDLVQDIADRMETNGRVLAIDTVQYTVQLGAENLPALIARMAIDQRGYVQSRVMDVRQPEIVARSA